MMRYDSYKDSDVEWIGEIPSGWVVGKLGFYSNVYRGSGYQYLNQVDDEFEEKKERVVRIGDFNDFTPIWCEYLEQFENYRIQKNDILVGGTGHYFGKSMFVTDEMEGLIHSYNIIRLVVKKQNSKFIQYYISSNLIREQMDISVLGSGQPFIDIQGLKGLSIIIPTTQEQQQIVSFLDTKTSLIDSLIEKTHRKIELLKEKRTSLINEVVTKGLNPNVEMKDSGVEWIGEIPSHWETTKFKFKGEVIIGLSYKPENQVDENDGVLVMRSSNVQNGKPSFHDNVYVNCKISDKLRTREGDILICSRNGSRRLIGKNCLITKEIEGMSWGVFMTMYRTPYYKFFYWLLNSPVFKSQSGLFLTSTINQLTVSTLENMVVPYVSDKIEQQQIVEYLDKQTGLIDKTISTEEKRIELLKEYRQSLISEVVTGKRKVVE